MRETARFLPVVLILTLLVSGCAAPPDQTVAKFLDAVKTLNTEEMLKCVVQEDGTKIESELQPEDQKGIQTLKTVFGRLSYKVGKPTVVKDTATVPVTITCIDMVTAMSNVMSKALGLAFATAFSDDKSKSDTQAVFEEMFTNALTDPNAPMATKEISLPLKKVEGRWLVVMNEQSSINFVNAVTGGLGTLAKAFGEQK